MNVKSIYLSFLLLLINQVTNGYLTYITISKYTFFKSSVLKPVTTPFYLRSERAFSLTFKTGDKI